MNRRGLLLFLLLVMFLLAQPVYTANSKDDPRIVKVPAGIDKDKDKIEDGLMPSLSAASAGKAGVEKVRVLIALNAPPSENDKALVKGLGGSVGQSWHRLVYAMSAEVPVKVLKGLAKNPRVVLVSADRGPKAMLFNTTKQIRADPAVWDTYGFNGSNESTIAILDTGLDDSHSDTYGYEEGNFSKKIVFWKDFIGAYGNGSEFYSTPTDNDGHGAHCSGIAAGEGVNDSTYKGVAPESRLAGFKVLNDTGSSDTWSPFLSALAWLEENASVYNITVASMSLGGSYSSTVDTAVNNLVASGVVPVCAAGNSYPSADIGSPGTASKCITVGAVSKEGNMSDYSSNGANGSGKPDVVAPGGSGVPTSNDDYVWSVDSNDKNAWPGLNNYYGLAGTSMAAPHVSGLASLIIEAMESQGEVWNWTEDQALKVKMLILMTAFETNQTGESGNTPTLDRSGKDLVEGYGMIAADAAIEAVIYNYTIGATENSTFGSSVADKKVWARKVLLSEGNNYTFNMSLPSGADYDLYLYNSTPDEYGEPQIVDNSTAAATGGNETIIYEPSSNDTFYLVAKWVGGSGTFNISSTAADIVQPFINITEPQNGSTINASHVFVNATISEQPDTCLLEWDNGTLENITMNTTTTTCYHNKTGLEDNTTYHFRIYANDSAGNMNVTSNFTITADWNNAPNVSDIPNITMLEDAYNDTINLSQYVTDSDGDNITWSVSGNVNVSVNITNGIANFTSDLDWYGNETIKFTANDSQLNDSDVVNVTVVPVNDPPNITAIPSISFQEDLYNDTLNLSNYVSDVEGDDVNWSFSGNDSIMVNIINNSLVNFTASANWSGSENITFTANDSQNVSSENVSVSVAPVNDPPVLYDIVNKSVNESETLLIALNATDIDSNLTYSTNTSLGSLNMTTGVFIWTPNFTQSGNYTWQFNATDGEFNASKTVNITVMNVMVDNDIKNITVPPLAYINESVNISTFIEGDNIDAVRFNISDNSSFYVLNTTSKGSVYSATFSNTSETGSYNVTVLANDTLGNKASRITNFTVSNPVSFNLTFADYNGSASNVSFKLLYDSTSQVRDEYVNSSGFNSTVAEGLWDMLLEQPKFNISLDDVNMSSDISLQLVVDDPPETVTISAARLKSVTEVVAVNITLDFASAVINISYNDSDYDESALDDQLHVYKCAGWNMSARSCLNDNWSLVDQSNYSVDNSSNIVSISTSSFSAFSLAKFSYCGDGVKDADENCDSCPEDYGQCPSTGGGNGWTYIPPPQPEPVDNESEANETNDTIKEPVIQDIIEEPANVTEEPPVEELPEKEYDLLILAVLAVVLLIILTKLL